jgi:2-hydroxychromene-2-carboxylate isomerase
MTPSYGGATGVGCTRTPDEGADAAMPEFPPPVPPPGEPPPPAEPHEVRRRHRVPAVVDDDVDLFGAEDAAARLADRLARVEPGATRAGDDGRPLLSPPIAPGTDRIEGPAYGRAGLVVFGAHGTPWSRTLGQIIAEVRRRHLATVGVAWRHYPDPAAHPRAAVFALATEAAAARARFWSLTRELLELRHYDPADLHGAMVRAGVDHQEALEAMRAGTGAERIADDVASALASGVTSSPALFVDGERYRGELTPGAVVAVLDVAVAARAGETNESKSAREA